ncbi:5-formyltetrahydrofolate cyclo-ligase [Paracoccus sp. TK19116]|uniref:5-formyltetrahydrofolate cyclo-ligase n=1 Tax=Paracoccus albicereus TaxID=2922394 RepID=A0ABT1MSE9_9RHOB|nr:5-formyltetrahydrofolate cyclo-ligase [Paracoccus albicereus]MCQ0971242.1 5-formyltetrahydrofolate cyclo-ligase [Paracoccus albicereus]
MSGAAPDKAALRAQALAARGQGGDQEAIDRRLIEVLTPFAGQILAGYWPIRDEADPRPAMRAHDGPVCLPVVPGRDVPLIFRAWDGGELERGSLGTAHPPESCEEMTPRVLIVPMAGFDRAGQRIGYGGGYYDRTLSLLRGMGPVAAIGCAFAVQELPHIPAGPYDQPLDMIVTDRGVIRVGRD